MGYQDDPLRVEIYGKHVGNLKSDINGHVTFHPVHGDDKPDKTISLSLMLSKHAHNFFQSLLPQGDNLTNIARQKNLSENDTYGLLKALGRDVAGSLQILDPETPLESTGPYLQELTGEDINSMMHSTFVEPLGNTRGTGMLSLGGYQDKIALVRFDDRWHRGHNGYPTTHILKPQSNRDELSGIIYCEAYGLDISRQAGVLDYQSWIDNFNGEDSLVIERFDRKVKDDRIERVHQENALQVLGLPDNAKYEMTNIGKISLKKFANAIRPYAGSKSQSDLLGLTVVNAAIGNLDAHAGNLGVLHHQDGTSELAPAYDMVINSHYLIGGGEQPLALFIGDQYKHKNISREELVREGTSWGMREEAAKEIVDEKLEMLKKAVDSVEPHPSTPEQAVENVQRYVNNLYSGGYAGNATPAPNRSR